MSHASLMPCPTEECPYCRGAGFTTKLVAEGTAVLGETCRDCKGVGKRCNISLLPIQDCDHDHAISKPQPRKF